MLLQGSVMYVMLIIYGTILEIQMSRQVKA